MIFRRINKGTNNLVGEKTWSTLGGGRGRVHGELKLKGWGVVISIIMFVLKFYNLAYKSEILEFFTPFLGTTSHSYMAGPDYNKRFITFFRTNGYKTFAVK